MLQYIYLHNNEYNKQGSFFYYEYKITYNYVLVVTYNNAIVFNIVHEQRLET